MLCFLKSYPGNLTRDSLSQISMVMGIKEFDSGVPILHTLVIGFFYKIGLAIGGTSNAGVATYVYAQMCFMAFIFSFLLFKLYIYGFKS